MSGINVSAKNENVNSGKLNNYTTNLSGDAHCCGVRVVVNTTFTAGGLAAPIFVVVYGLTPDKMPGDDIVSVSVPGLTVVSDTQIFTEKEGFIAFVRGKFEVKDNEGIDEQDEHDEEDLTEEALTHSKEARIAKLYREKVYHPFIQEIRKTQYGYSGEGPIPEHLLAVSWMDGANGQLKLITSDENIQVEKNLKITCCKHSAARTATEQSADASPNFKLMKKNVKIMDNPHHCFNPILSRLEKILSSLENGDGGEIVILKSHKKGNIKYSTKSTRSNRISIHCVQRLKGIPV